MNFRCQRRRHIACLLFGVALATGQALAHHAPEEMIAELSRRIDRGDGGAIDHFARATEYRTLGRHAEAAADYRAALALAPSMAEAHRELAQLAAGLGAAALGEAETEARAAIALAEPGRSQARSRIVLAEILEAAGRPDEAVDACETALLEHPAGDVDWFLLRSRCQAQLGSIEDRIKGLEEAQSVIAAGVLRVEWIEALLDGGEWPRALPEIERELAEARLRSSWLIRRARVFLANGRSDEARHDLLQARAEIDSRLHPQRPDPGLIADRGVACALLGDSAEARTELARLSQVHADASFRLRVEKALFDSPSMPTAPD